MIIFFSCGRRWRHEKPNGAANVEKVNGSSGGHVSLLLLITFVDLQAWEKSFYPG